MESEQYDFRILCNKPSDNIGYVKKKKKKVEKNLVTLTMIDNVFYYEELLYQ